MIRIETTAGRAPTAAVRSTKYGTLAYAYGHNKHNAIRSAVRLARMRMQRERFRDQLRHRALRSQHPTMYRFKQSDGTILEWEGVPLMSADETINIEGTRYRLALVPEKE